MKRLYTKDHPSPSTKMSRNCKRFDKVGIVFDSALHGLGGSLILDPKCNNAHQPLNCCHPSSLFFESKRGNKQQMAPSAPQFNSFTAVFCPAPGPDIAASLPNLKSQTRTVEAAGTILKQGGLCPMLRCNNQIEDGKSQVSMLSPLDFALFLLSD